MTTSGPPLAETGIDHAHLVGCSYSTGICVELALEHPGPVDSLLLVAPAGSLLTVRTDDFARFLDAESVPSSAETSTLPRMRT